MRFLRRRTSTPPPPVNGGSVDATHDLAELEQEIGAVRAELGDHENPALERRLLTLRHLAGIKLLESPPPGRAPVEPATNGFQPGALPEIGPDRISAAIIRGAILSSGGIVVRGLIPRDDALALADRIEDALQAWEAAQAGRDHDPGLFEEFVPEPGFLLQERQWVNSAGGIWTADSPRLMGAVIEQFESSGLLELAAEYLGERPLLSVQKGTLRKVPPSAGRSWHQDGSFLNVGAINTWISLSRCGDEAPGLDVVPKRINRILETGTEGATFSWSISEQVALEAAGETSVQRPIFEPGDVMLFDEVFLHTTAAEPTMPRPRYAVETWFFGSSAFAEGYAPILP